MKKTYISHFFAFLYFFSSPLYAGEIYEDEGNEREFIIADIQEEVKAIGNLGEKESANGTDTTTRLKRALKHIGEFIDTPNLTNLSYDERRKTVQYLQEVAQTKPNKFGEALEKVSAKIKQYSMNKAQNLISFAKYLPQTRTEMLKNNTQILQIIEDFIENAKSITAIPNLDLKDLSYDEKKAAIDTSKAFAEKTPNDVNGFLLALKNIFSKASKANKDTADDDLSKLIKEFSALTINDVKPSSLPKNFKDTGITLTEEEKKLSPEAQEKIIAQKIDAALKERQRERDRKKMDPAKVVRENAIFEAFENWYEQALEDKNFPDFSKISVPETIKTDKEMQRKYAELNQAIYYKLLNAGSSVCANHDLTTCLPKVKYSLCNSNAVKDQKGTEDCKKWFDYIVIPNLTPLSKHQLEVNTAQTSRLLGGIQEEANVNQRQGQEAMKTSSNLYDQKLIIEDIRALPPLHKTELSLNKLDVAKRFEKIIKQLQELSPQSNIAKLAYPAQKEIIENLRFFRALDTSILEDIRALPPLHKAALSLNKLDVAKHFEKIIKQLQELRPQSNIAALEYPTQRAIVENLRFFRNLDESHDGNKLIKDFLSTVELVVLRK